MCSKFHYSCSSFSPKAAPQHPSLLVFASGRSKEFQIDIGLSSDLDVSDYFLNSITLRWGLLIYLLSFPHVNCICRAFLKPRCKIAWAACYSTALPEPTVFSPIISNTSTASPFLINTAFDFSLKENSSTTARYNEKDQQNQFNYTQTQRISAEQAVRTTSLTDLHQKVSLFWVFW